MRLIDEIEAAANDSEGKHPLCISEKQWEAYSLVSSSYWDRIKAALLAGEEMTQELAYLHGHGRLLVPGKVLEIMIRFRAATEGTK